MFDYPLIYKIYDGELSAPGTTLGYAHDEAEARAQYATLAAAGPAYLEDQPDRCESSLGEWTLRATNVAGDQQYVEPEPLPEIKRPRAGWDQYAEAELQSLIDRFGVNGILETLALALTDNAENASSLAQEERLTRVVAALLTARDASEA